MLSYGPYLDIQPFSKTASRVHYLHKLPILIAETIRRDVEISHWGNNLSIEEHYLVENKGPS